MGAPRAEPHEEDAALTYRRLLGARLHLHCGARLAVAATILVAGSFAYHVVGIDLELEALSAVAGFIALYNLAPWMLSRGLRDPDVAARRYESAVRLSYLGVVLDYVSLTLVIWLVGGGRSPFVGVYLLHVIVGAVLLSRRDALKLTALAYLLLVGLVVVEWTGVAPPPLPTGAVASDDPLDGRFALTMLLVYGVLFGVISFRLTGLTRQLRSGERRIHIANAELDRLSEQRRGFLQVAMHNLKAPLGAVTMFLENIRCGLAGPVTDTQRDWLDRSLERIQDLREFLADMQLLSAVESSIIRSTYVPVDLAGVVEDIVQKYRDVAAEHGLELRLEAAHSLPPVVGHPRLLREAIVNYVTNAIQYTPPGGHVVVRILRTDGHLRAEVVDDGVGIAPEDQKELFGELVQVFERGARNTLVRGTGLGLAIVRRIALAHDGRVGVESQPGCGSTFFLEVPALIE